METDRLLSSSLSCVGRTRKENQDACGEFRNAIGERLLIVADGMGGHAGGVTASRLCVETVAQIFESGQGPPADRLRHGLEEANRVVYAASQADPTLRGMGTTGVALLFDPGGTVSLAWVGDSRAYRLRAGEFEQLSEDHSLVAEWVRVGRISAEEAETDPRRNELARAIGPEPTVTVDLLSFTMDPGDTYLLCSDGLCGYLSKADISAIVDFESPDEATRQLIDRVNVERNSPDNVTVQIMAVPGDIEGSAAPVRQGSQESDASNLSNAEEMDVMGDDVDDFDDTGYPRTRKTLLVGISVLIVAALLAGLTWYQMSEKKAKEAAIEAVQAEHRAQELAEEAAREAKRVAVLAAELDAKAAREEAARLEATRLAEQAREEAQAREAALAREIEEAKAALAREQAAVVAAAREAERREAAEVEEILAEQEARRLEAAALEEARANELALKLEREVDTFVSEWIQALKRGDYSLYRKLGFRESESEFREIYGDGVAGYQIGVLEKKWWEGGFVALHVSETYDPPGSEPGFEARQTQRRLVLRPTANGMRFAGDRTR
jgi:serine/threonine protein phosphatase PrpC